MFRTTATAEDASEAAVQEAAIEEGVELAVDVTRQGAAVVTLLGEA